MNAGVNSFPGDEVMLDLPVDILCSYFYFRNVDMATVQSWGTRIIGDSGAFSAFTSGSEVDREEFHEWADRWSDSLFWVASLDVIGDPEGTRANWEAARRDGLSLVPTLHYGASTDALGWYVEQGADLIGLGGMVPYSSEPDRLMRWLVPMFKWVRDHAPHVRFHGWGISHPRLVDRLPWWSTDSSGFSSVFRFGTLRLWLPHRERFVSVPMDGQHLRRHDRTLREVYGVRDWRHLSVSTPANRRHVGRVAYRSVQLYARWLQKRQQVTPPPSLTSRLTQGSGSGDLGPSYVAAANLQDMVMNPDGSCKAPEVGPAQETAMGRAGSAQFEMINPDGSCRPPAGPRQVGALGWADSQVTKAISPNDQGAP